MTTRGLINTCLNMIYEFKRYDKAIAFCNEAIRRDPDSAEIDGAYLRPRTCLQWPGAVRQGHRRVHRSHPPSWRAWNQELAVGIQKRVQASRSQNAKNKRNGKFGLPSQTENPISAETSVPACEQGGESARANTECLCARSAPLSMSAIEKLCGGLFRS